MEQRSKTKLFGAGIALLAVLAIAGILFSGCMGIGGAPNYVEKPELLVPASADTYFVVQKDISQDKDFINFMDRIFPTFENEYTHYLQMQKRSGTLQRMVVFMNAQALADGMVEFAKTANANPGAANSQNAAILKFMFQDSRVGFISVYNGTTKDKLVQEIKDSLNQSASLTKGAGSFSALSELNYSGVTYYEATYSAANPPAGGKMSFDYYFTALDDNTMVAAFSEQTLKDMVDVYQGNAKPFSDPSIDEVKAKLKPDAYLYVVGKVPKIDTGTSPAKTAGMLDSFSNISYYGFAFDKSGAGLEADLALKFASEDNANKSVKTVQSVLTLYSTTISLPPDSQYMKDILNRVEVNYDGQIGWLKATITPDEMGKINAQYIDPAIQRLDKEDGLCAISAPQAMQDVNNGLYMRCDNATAYSENGQVKLDLELSNLNLFVDASAFGNSVGPNAVQGETVYLLGYSCGSILSAGTGAGIVRFDKPIQMNTSGWYSTGLEPSGVTCKYSYGDPISQNVGERFTGQARLEYCIGSPDCETSNPDNLRVMTGMVNAIIRSERPKPVAPAPVQMPEYENSTAG